MARRGRPPLSKAKRVLRKRFGAQLRAKREALGLSQSEAAALIGIGRTFYQQVETGVRSLPYRYRHNAHDMLRRTAKREGSS